MELTSSELAEKQSKIESISKMKNEQKRRQAMGYREKYSKERRERQMAENEGHLYPQKICPTCGKAFWPNVPYRVYCSEKCQGECKTKYYAKDNERRIQKRMASRVEIPCKVCGKMFLPDKKWVVTCSAYCKRQNYLQGKKEQYERYKKKHGLTQCKFKEEAKNELELILT